ncbi:hypothetical protein EYR41_011095 [Orbilia oligospora]|uniref:Uncharacterized protein n=1 Tax=Orbilia oligospora TaxID=2813651 RepID=A0A7C8PHW4_ORBOL|nr:hypothetical protein TWF751_003486 [Orbilia oligospora]TGJ63154.1 hypothetical protein EYR41_011095 [Orbilia oligospora]
MSEKSWSPTEYDSGSKGRSVVRGAPVENRGLNAAADLGNFEDVEVGLGLSSKSSTRTNQQDSPGPILSDIISCLPPQTLQSLRTISKVYSKWIRRIILTRIVFIALTNPSRISGAISGVLGLCFAQLWLRGNESCQRAADSILSIFVIIAAYIKSDPVTFQVLLGDFYQRRETDARQTVMDGSTPYRHPLAYCLEPYTSPLAFCYDPVVFIPAMLIVYRKLASYFVCPGFEGRIIDALSIVTALFTIWMLFPEFSWDYAMNGRPWTAREVYYDHILAAA